MVEFNIGCLCIYKSILHVRLFLIIIHVPLGIFTSYKAYVVCNYITFNLINHVICTPAITCNIITGIFCIFPAKITRILAIQGCMQFQLGDFIDAG